MNRRSFLKTTAAVGAAALLCPSLLIQPQRRRSIDLRTFCATAPYPHKDRAGKPINMAHPFEQQDLTYATDSRVCVRVAPVPADSTLGRADLPPAADLPWWDHRTRTGFVEAPEHPTIIEAEDWCLTCDGRGVANYSQTIEHEACEGFGCQKCEQTGRMMPNGTVPPWCPACDGNAKVVRPSIVIVGSAWYAIEQWERLRTLGSFELSPAGNVMDRARWCVANWHIHPSRFVFAEGVGLQMPLDPETAQKRIDEARRREAYRKLFPVS
jgi:hypothetical protein